MQWAWAMAGSGPRRWSALDRCGGDPLAALAVADQDVRQRRSLRLGPGDRRRQARQMLKQLQADLDQGWAVAGFWGYELGAALEGLEAEPGGPADAEWICFNPEALQRVTLPEVHAPPRDLAAVPPEDLLRQRNGFVASAREVLERIAAGEVYQVNLSAEVAVPISEWPAPLRALAAVQAVQPVPFAAVFRGQSHLLISGSMERFLAVRGAQVSSRPIKGTAPRRTDPLQDAAEARSLRASAKECAENTMIVDMVRNDLQRAARRGSVRVTDLLATEPYATLWHLESEIAASLTRPRRLDALLEATMPAASVTGCPKIQAMRVIAQLERRRRGPYCGAVGLALPGGPVDLAVAIRTLWLDEHQARFAVGAGLVADSVPEAEWLETCLKARSPLAILASIQEPRAIPEGP